MGTKTDHGELLLSGLLQKTEDLVLRLGLLTSITIQRNAPQTCSQTSLIEVVP